MSTAVPDRVAVIGLGGNLGADAAIVDRFGRARDALAGWGTVRGSTVYRSAALGGPAAQGDFLNAAVSIAFADPEPLPAELIAAVLEIERMLGRDRMQEVRNGPRLIDLDVLLWGARHQRWDGLAVPHPRLAVRRFALAPAIELHGEDIVVPGTGQTLGELWAAIADQRVEPTGFRI